MSALPVRLTALALMLAACARGEQGAESADATLAALVAPVACGTVFTPDAELAAETADAAARWSAATGCSVRVGDGGIGVRLVDVVRDAAGNEYSSPGGMRVDADGLTILVTLHREADVVLHEMGHALNPWAGETHPGGHIQPKTDGSECSALMCSGGGSSLITADDLAMVCDAFACEAFVPEA